MTMILTMILSVIDYNFIRIHSLSSSGSNIHDHFRIQSPWSFQKAKLHDHSRSQTPWSFQKPKSMIISGSKLHDHFRIYSTRYLQDPESMIISGYMVNYHMVKTSPKVPRDLFVRLSVLLWVIYCRLVFIDEDGALTMIKAHHSNSIDISQLLTDLQWHGRTLYSSLQYRIVQYDVWEELKKMLITVFNAQIISGQFKRVFSSSRVHCPCDIYVK